MSLRAASKMLRAGLFSLVLSMPGAALADGTVSGVVFDGPGGEPVPGLVVQVPGTAARATTDRDGAFVLSLPAGTWTLELLGSVQGAVRVPVEDGASTEVLVGAFDNGRPPLVLLEAPAGGGSVGVDPTVETVQVHGRVRAEGGGGLEGARVFVRGQAVEVQTDGDGRFTLELPVGVHTLSVLRSGYATRTVPEVAVPTTDGAPFDIELVEAGVALADFSVRVPRVEGGASTLLAERQSSSGVVDSLSAEEMSRRGDSSAAAALGRVTGLTVVGGKFVYVRGMGERYSATLLNGSNLPSPEPERRVVPLDLFPTSMLESVVIQKTFSPSTPAEFGGGVVRLRTRGIPDGPLLKLKLSGRYTRGSSWVSGPMALSGDTDFWGRDDGSRAMPEALREATKDQKLVLESRFKEGFSGDELEALGESLDPRRWKVVDGKTLPDLSTSMSAGHGIELGNDSAIGVLAGLNFSNAWERREYTHRYLNTRDGDLYVQNRYDFDDLSNQVRLGGMGVAQARIAGNHDLRYTALLVRDSEDMARRYEGFNEDFGADIRVSRVDWVERELFLHQLTGEHRFPGLGSLELDWRASVSKASRQEPDRRDLILEQSTETDAWFLRTQGGGNGLLFSTLDDENIDGGADLRLPFGARDDDPDRWGGWGGKVAVGAAVANRERAVDTRRFSFDVVGGGEEGATDFIYSADPSEIFAEDNIRSDGLRLAETTLETDRYTASSALAAQYLQLDLRFPWAMQLMTGARREESLQSVLTKDPFTESAELTRTKLYRLDVLPALTVTQGIPVEAIPGTMQVRGGYGRTLNRPDFRELSPAVYYDVVGGRETRGEPTLERALIDNYDLRWEWYPAPMESVSLGGFVKTFQDPIESYVVASIASRQSYTNARGATNKGIELDFRKSLGFGSKTGWDDLYLSGNGALIRSQVDLRGAEGFQTSAQRPLQGQSPYVVNLGLSYEPMDTRVPLSASLLLNRAGPRIRDVGAEGIPDEVEETGARLDAVGSVGLGAGWRLGMSGRNLLDAATVRTVGPRVVREVRTGWSVGLGLSWEAADWWEGRKERQRAD